MPVTNTDATGSDVAPYDSADYASLKEYSIFDKGTLINSYKRIVADASSDTDLKNIGTTETPDYAVKLNLANGLIESNLFDTSSSYNPVITLSEDETATAPSNAENTGLSDVFTKDALKANPDYSSFMAKYPFSSTNILLLRAKQPSAYTATIDNGGSGFEVSADTYYMLSFWVKTTEIISGSGASITVIDKGDGTIDESDYVETAFSAIDTTTIENDPDYYDGWTKYTFYISNGSNTNGTRYFDIKLNFGLTTQSIKKSDYNTGWAAFTNFVFDEVSENIFNSISAGTYVKTAELNAGYTSNVSDTGIDTVSPGEDENTIKTMPATPANYYGVTGGTSLTGTKDTNGNYIYPEAVLNSDVISGLINYKYMNAYGLGCSLGGNSIQPLLIKNTANTSYGYISKASKTLAADSTTEIRVRVKVRGTAKAYIYLASSLTADSYNVLSIKRPVYDEEEAKTRTLCQTVTNTEGATDSDGWVIVSFFITAGDTALDYRIELWNGARDGSANCTGTVLFDLLAVNTLTDTTYADLLALVDSTQESLKYTQQPTDEDDETEYEEMVVYANDTLNNRMFVNYSPIDVTVEDETTEDEEETTDEDTPINTNILLMVSSLVMALALIVTLILVAIKRFKIRITRNKRDATTRYLSKKKHFKKDSKAEETDLEDDDIEDSLDATDDSDDNEELPSDTSNDENDDDKK